MWQFFFNQVKRFLNFFFAHCCMSRIISVDAGFTLMGVSPEPCIISMGSSASVGDFII